jgi:SAM-dependent methyltransferase
MHQQALTRERLIYGASAPFDGSNVRARMRAMDELHLVGGDAFADIGCGAGSYSRELLRRCRRRISFVDVLESNIAATRELVGRPAIEVDFHTAPAEHLPLLSSAYDVALLIEVLDHVDDVGAVLSEVHRILRPGGRCYITVPNRLYPLETHPVLLGGRFVRPQFVPFLPWIPPLHRRLATARVFSARSLQGLAREAGFASIRLARMMPPLERRGGPRARAVMRALSRTPLRVFGVSLVAVLYR